MSGIVCCIDFGNIMTVINVFMIPRFLCHKQILFTFIRIFYNSHLVQQSLTAHVTIKRQVTTQTAYRDDRHYEIYKVGDQYGIFNCKLLHTSEFKNLA